MSLAKKIGKNTAISYTQSLVTLFLGAVGSYFVIKALSLQQLGYFSLSMSIVWIVLSWTDLGISQVVSADVAGYLGSGNLSSIKRLLSDFFKLKTLISIIVGVLIVIVSFYLPTKYDQQFIYLLRISSLVVFIFIIKGLVLTTFEGFSNFFQSALTQIVESITKFIFLIVFVLYFKLDAMGVMLSYVFSASLCSIFAIPFIYKILSPLKSVSADPLPLLKNQLFSHGKFQAFTQPIKALGDNLQVWIIGLFAGISAVAIYQVASQICGYVTMFLSSFEGVLTPVLSEEISKSAERGKFIIQRMSKYILWFSTFVMFAAYVFVPILIKFLFGSKYDVAIFLLYIMFLSIPIQGIGVPMRPAFFAFKGQKFLLKIHILTVIVIYPLAALVGLLFGGDSINIGFSLAIPLAALFAFWLRARALRKYYAEPVFYFRSFFQIDGYDKDLIKRIHYSFIRRLGYEK